MEQQQSYTKPVKDTNTPVTSSEFMTFWQAFGRDEMKPFIKFRLVLFTAYWIYPAEINNKRLVGNEVNEGLWQTQTGLKTWPICGVRK